MKPPLVKSLKLQLNGVSTSLRLAGLFVLAAELEHLHKVKNYHIKGRSVLTEKGSNRPAWPRYCILTAGISDGTVRNYLECWNVLKFRLHYDSRPEAKAILQLMTQRPSELSDDERQKMIQGIATLALKEGDTPDSLKKENREPSKAQGDGCMATHEMPDDMELLALACGVNKQSAKRVARIIEDGRREYVLRKAAKSAVQMLIERNQREN